MLNDCVISRFHDNETHDTILFKNRDRAYNPILEIVREYRDNIEIVYMRDVVTDWSEGLNSKGVGILNSALSVGYDENEKMIVKKTGKKSKDGKVIRNALYQPSFKESVKSLLNFESGVRGHTIISKPDKYIIIESTSKHNPKIKGSNEMNNIVRTNHGFFHVSAGYTEGDNYLSSKVRKDKSLEVVSSVKNYKDLPAAIRKNFYNYGQLNPVRNSGKIYTTSQTMMNLDKLEFNLYLLEGKYEEFRGVRNVNIPQGYDNQIKINVYQVKRKK